MIIFDGKSLSEKILFPLKFLPNTSLDVILVGNDPSSLKYVELKQKKCLELGVKFTFHHLEEKISESELISLVKKLNTSSEVTGFFIQLPLPSNFNQVKILSHISPQKDVDGLNPASGIVPAVDTGIVKLLDEYHLSCVGKKIVIVNDSSLIGLPLKSIFENRRATVILCNKLTENLLDITSTADILISATGVKNLITPSHVKEGAIVLDVASGDVDFEAVKEKCSYITPTFGCIGPLTIACLLSNISPVMLNIALKKSAQKKL